MSKYGIATIFGDYPVGYEFTTANLPLHLTHVDSFEIELGPQALADELAKALLSHKQFSIKAVKDSYYGPEKDILVTELELTPELIKLHTSIMAVLRAHGAILKHPHLHNESYRPHISVYGDRRVEVGDTLTISQLSIAVKVADTEDANRKILATILL